MTAAAVLALSFTTNAGGFHGGGGGGGFRGGGCLWWRLLPRGLFLWRRLGFGVRRLWVGCIFWLRVAGLLRRLRLLRIRAGLRRASICRAGLHHTRLHQPQLTRHRFIRDRFTRQQFTRRSRPMSPLAPTTYAAPVYARDRPHRRLLPPLTPRPKPRKLGRRSLSGKRVRLTTGRLRQHGFLLRHHPIAEQRRAGVSPAPRARRREQLTER